LRRPRAVLPAAAHTGPPAGNGRARAAPGAPQRRGTGRCAAGAPAGDAGQLLPAGPDGAQLWAAARRGAATTAAAAGRHLGAAAARPLGLAVRGLRRAHRSAVERAGALRVRLPESLVSSWLPGRMVLSYGQLRAEVLHQLRRLPAGTSELLLHPSPGSAAAWLP